MLRIIHVTVDQYRFHHYQFKQIVWLSLSLGERLITYRVNNKQWRSHRLVLIPCSDNIVDYRLWVVMHCVRSEFSQKLIKEFGPRSNVTFRNCYFKTFDLKPGNTNIEKKLTIYIKAILFLRLFRCLWNIQSAILACSIWKATNW